MMCEKGAVLYDTYRIGLLWLFAAASVPEWRSRIQNCQRAWEKHVNACSQCRHALREVTK